MVILPRLAGIVPLIEFELRNRFLRNNGETLMKSHTLTESSNKRRSFCDKSERHSLKAAHAVEARWQYSDERVGSSIEEPNAD